MANAKIIAVGPGEVSLLADLYGRVLSPARDEAFFTRRFLGKHNVSLLVAMLDDDHVGFSVGYELKPGS